MGVTLKPRSSSGLLFSVSHRATVRARGSNSEDIAILANDDSKPAPFRQLTPAEFARLSSSMQLTLLTIRRAQVSSRNAVVPPDEKKTRYTDS